MGEDGRCVRSGVEVVEGWHQHDAGEPACDHDVRWGYCAECADCAEVGYAVYSLYGLTAEEIEIVEGRA